MPPTVSAGVLLYRRRAALFTTFEFLLIHPGGPYWAKKNLGAWSIPKGEVHQNEDLLAAAVRELHEETGFAPPHSAIAAAKSPIPLTPVRLRSGKTIHAWAIEADPDAGALPPFVSNTFTIEWPPKSGKYAAFPEADRAAFFTAEEALKHIHPAQAPFITELQPLLASD